VRAQGRKHRAADAQLGSRAASWPTTMGNSPPRRAPSCAAATATDRFGHLAKSILRELYTPVRLGTTI